MKKITFGLMMLLSITAFSQIEIVENFDNSSNNGQINGWTSADFATSSSAPCGGEGYSESANIPANSTGSLTTPLYTSVSNGTDLTVSFDYNIVEIIVGFPPTFNGPPEGWGSIVLEYTTDGSNWTSITSADDSVFTYTGLNLCASSGSFTVSSIAAGSDFQARFSIDNMSQVGLFFSIDNVSFTQEALTVPNCDAVLTSPLAGADTVESDVTLMWSEATGLATGYKVYVGTTSGATDVVNGATTMTNSYELTNLAYEQDYFVTLVATNSFGDATGCTEESFTTRTAPIAGTSCGAPIVISSFPYLSTGNTADYEDNTDVSPCNNNFYMSGKDVFYEYTPTNDVSVNISMTNISNNGSSIHVVNGCIDTATECVTYAGDYSTNTRMLEEVVFLAGNTYYIVLSNSSSSRTYTYDLLMLENNCINPSFTTTPVADCANGQFNVNVDVTYLGSATQLTLTDNDASTAYTSTVTSTGIVSMGPYASGTSIDFTLTNNDDTSCSYVSSTFFYCPPTNDECTTPTALVINTDDTCSAYLSASNAGATQSTADATSCTSDNDNDVWFSFQATSEVIILEYSNVVSASGYLEGGTLQATELLEGTCGALTSLNCYTGNYVTFTNLTIGDTYYIRNYTSLGVDYAQNFDICLKEPIAAPVNDTCMAAATLTVSTDDMCNNQVTGTTAGATQTINSSCGDGFNDVWYVFNPTADGVYEFSYEKLITSPTSNYFIYEGTCGSLVEKSTSCTSSSNQIFSLESTQTYYVMVRSSQSGAGVTFNLCVTQLPDATENNDCSSATILLESTDENGNNAISGNLENSYPSPEACSTSYKSVWYSFTPSLTGVYNFDFTRNSGYAYYKVYNTSDCAQTSSVTGLSGFTSCYTSSDKSTELVANNTYLISVHVSASSSSEFTLFAYPDPSLSIDTPTANFEGFKYYPNPVLNTLTVEANQAISSVAIYNIVGQQVSLSTPNNISSTIEMSDLKQGVYFVKITINNIQKTIKVIKK